LPEDTHFIYTQNDEYPTKGLPYVASLKFGPVRLSEFWRNLDGLEECWRNLGEENTVPDEKISGSRRV